MRNYTGISLVTLSSWLIASGAWGHGAHQHAEQPAQQAQTPAPSQAPAPPQPELEVLRVLSDYRFAMQSKSVEKLEAVVDPGLLVLEGVHKNVGWPDYRDNHLAGRNNEHEAGGRAGGGGGLP